MLPGHKKLTGPQPDEGQPRAGRPRMPKGYGVPTRGRGSITWPAFREKLTQSHTYWVGTTRPDGRPHCMPVWGVWSENKFYFSTDRGSRKGLNLAANSAVVVHLESGEDVAIVEGLAREMLEVPPTVDQAYLTKYKMRMTSLPPGAVPLFLEVTPRVAFAWHEQNIRGTATRWVFAGQ